MMVSFQHVRNSPPKKEKIPYKYNYTKNNNSLSTQYREATAFGNERIYTADHLYNITT